MQKLFFFVFVLIRTHLSDPEKFSFGYAVFKTCVFEIFRPTVFAIILSCGVTYSHLGKPYVSHLAGLAVHIVRE